MVGVEPALNFSHHTPTSLQPLRERISAMSQPGSSQAAYPAPMQSYSSSQPGANLAQAPEQTHFCPQHPQHVPSEKAFPQDSISQPPHFSGAGFTEVQQAPMFLQPPSGRPYGQPGGLRKPSVSPWHFASQVKDRWPAYVLRNSR